MLLTKHVQMEGILSGRVLAMLGLSPPRAARDKDCDYVVQRVGGMVKVSVTKKHQWCYILKKICLFQSTFKNIHFYYTPI